MLSCGAETAWLHTNGSGTVRPTNEVGQHVVAGADMQTCGMHVRMHSAYVGDRGTVTLANELRCRGSPGSFRKEHDAHVGCHEVNAAGLEGAEVLRVRLLRPAQAQSPCMLPSDLRG